METSVGTPISSLLSQETGYNGVEWEVFVLSDIGGEWPQAGVFIAEMRNYVRRIGTRGKGGELLGGEGESC